jgi:hypothetical protein
LAASIAATRSGDLARQLETIDETMLKDAMELVLGHVTKSTMPKMEIARCRIRLAINCVRRHWIRNFRSSIGTKPFKLKQTILLNERDTVSTSVGLEVAVSSLEVSDSTDLHE